MKRQMMIGAGLTLLVIAILGGVKFLQIKRSIAQAALRKTPPAAVTSFKTAAVEWPFEISAVGELAPVQGATLAAEELGEVMAIHFESGAVVQEGQVLVELDTSLEQAELKSAQAALELAQIELKRQRALRANNANSVADLDRAAAAERAALADTERLKAQIARKQVIAPFTGQTGARLVNQGQILAPGTAVVSLQALDKLYLNFTAPQRFIGRLKAGLSVQFEVDAFPGRRFSGALTTIEPAVDAKTRNIGLQATAINEGRSLRPGMFADVTVVLPEAETVVAIPAASVNFAPYGDTVYVLEQMKGEDGEKEYLGARPQIVKLGRRRGDLIAVLSGLKPGEEIASSGAFKLMPKMPVVINNDVAPGQELNPQPSDA